MDSTVPDLSALAVLVAVAETLSFSKAATRLGVTKGTVSRKIAHLEERLGVDLVQRTTRHVSLSAAGQGIYARAREPLQALAALTSELPEQDARLAGEIRMTAPPDLGSVVLPEILERFSLLHPAVTFHVRLTNETIDLVRAGIDIALRIAVRQLSSSALRVRAVGRASFGFYASPSYVARRGPPQSFGDPRHDWLMFAPTPVDGGGPSPQERAYFGLRKGFLPKVRSDDFVLVRELVQRGVGVAGLPDFFAEPMLRTGAIVRVLAALGGLPRGTIFMVTPARKKIPARIEAFREHLVESLLVREKTRKSHALRNETTSTKR